MYFFFFNVVHVKSNQEKKKEQLGLHLTNIYTFQDAPCLRILPELANKLPTSSKLTTYFNVKFKMKSD